MRSIFKVLIVALLPAAAIFVACSSNDSSTGGGDAGPTLCSASTPCPSGLVCGYDDATGCSTQGECVVKAAQPPAFYACGCQGQQVSYVASGYTSAPVASSGPCVDAASSQDAGNDSGGDSAAPAEGGSEGGSVSEGGAEGGSDGGSGDASDAGTD